MKCIQVIWTQTYSTQEHGLELWDVVQTSDGGYFLVGEQKRSSSEGFDFPSVAYYAKTDAEGHLTWEDVFQFQQFHNTGFRTVTPSAGGGFVAGGYIEGGRACCAGITAARIEDDGTLAWGIGENSIAGVVNSNLIYEAPDRTILLVAPWTAVFRLSAGGVIREVQNHWREAGYSSLEYAARTADLGVIATGDDRDNNVAITRIDSSGSTSWQRSLTIAHESAPIVELAEGGYLVADVISETQPEMRLLKLDTQGHTLDQQSYTLTGDEIVLKAALLDEDTVLFAGDVSQGEEQDIVLIKVGLSTTTAVEDTPDDRSPARLLPNYPDPFRAETVIPFRVTGPTPVTIKIYDVLGREVAVLAEGIYATGRYEVTWNAGQLSSGVYLCRMQIGLHVETELLLLQQ